MFFDYKILASRDSRFAIIWKLACSAKVSRSEILSVNVADVCKSLRDKIPTGVYSSKNIREQFSLYLLISLVNGIVILHAKQASLLERDMLEVFQSLRALKLMSAEDVNDGKRHGDPPPKKQKLLDVQDLLMMPPANIDQQLFKLLHQARISEITLDEPETFGFQQMFNSMAEAEFSPMTAEELLYFEHTLSSQKSQEPSNDALALRVMEMGQFGAAVLTADSEKSRAKEDVVLAPGDKFLTPVMPVNELPTEDVVLNADATAPQQLQSNGPDVDMEQQHKVTQSETPTDSGDALGGPLPLSSLSNNSPVRAMKLSRPRKLIIDEEPCIDLATIQNNVYDWSSVIDSRHRKVSQCEAAYPYEDLSLHGLMEAGLTAFKSCKRFKKLFPPPDFVAASSGDAKFLLDEEDDDDDKIYYRCDYVIEGSNVRSRFEAENEYLQSRSNQQFMNNAQESNSELAMEMRRRFSHDNRVELRRSELKHASLEEHYVSITLHSSSEEEKQRVDFKKRLADCPKPVSFFDLVPRTVLRKAAARKFALLLESLRSGAVHSARQDTPYGDITLCD